MGARKLVGLLLVTAIIGCGDDGGNVPDAAVDAASSIDAAGNPDAPVADAPAVDASPDATPDAMPDATLADAPPPDADPATTVMVAPVDDATICDPAGAIGDGDLFVGTTAQPTNRRAFIRFDLTAVPAGATILSATLEVTVFKDTGSRAVSLHAVTSDWNEGASTPTQMIGGGCGTAASDDATWANTGLGGAWTTAGGDFVASPSATTADIEATALTSAQMVTDVNAWIATPVTNFGWILVHPLEGTQSNVVRLTSADTRLVLRYLP